MKWRANITNILRHYDDMQRLIEGCSKVKDAKYIYGEFDDEDTAEIVERINSILKAW